MFVNISKKMSELGHERDWQQCRKRHNGETGRGKFFKELDAILGHRPASVPSVLLDTGATSQSSSASAQPEDSAPKEKANGKSLNSYRDTKLFVRCTVQMTGML